MPSPIFDPIVARGSPSPSLAGPRRHRDRAARRLPARGRRPDRARGSPSSSSARRTTSASTPGSRAARSTARRPWSRSSARSAWPVGHSTIPPSFASASRPGVAPRGVHRRELLRPARRAAARATRSFEAADRGPGRRSHAASRGRGVLRGRRVRHVDRGSVGRQHGTPPRPRADDARAVHRRGRRRRRHPGAGPAPHRHRPRSRGRAGPGDDARPADGRPPAVRPRSPRCSPPPSPRSVPLAAAGIEPIGAIDLYEPHPGAAVNVTVLVIGLAVVFVGVLAATALTGALQGRRRVDAAVARELRRRPGQPRWEAPRRPSSACGSPLEAGRGARAVPVRSAITGAMVGLAGVVAGLVFVSSLDRLIASPARSAIPYDVGIADVTRDDLEGEVLGQPARRRRRRHRERAAVGRRPRPSTGTRSTTCGARSTSASRRAGCRGRPTRSPWGSAPRRTSDVGAGDTVTVPTARRRGARARGGRRRRSSPPSTARSSASTRCSPPRASRRTPPRRAVHAARPWRSRRARTSTSSRSSWRREFEADAQAVPVAVQNLEQLGGLPAGVAAIVGSIAVLALANALVVAVRRRRTRPGGAAGDGLHPPADRHLGRGHGPRHRRHRRAGRACRSASRSARRCGGSPRRAPSCCRTPTSGGSSCCCPSSAPCVIALVAALDPGPPGGRPEPRRGAPGRVGRQPACCSSQSWRRRSGPSSSLFT